MWTYSKHVLKYVYTVAPDRVILWACALPVSAKRDLKCHLNTAPRLRLMSSIITILFVKRKGLKMTML